VRSAEGRKKIVKCVFAGHIHTRQVKTPLVSIAIEEVVFSNGGVEEIPPVNPRRICGRYRVARALLLAYQASP
jgi:hypothetical protein